MMDRKTGASTTGWLKIDLQGADSEHYRTIKRRTTRAIPFPDGVTRLITMERGDWEAYDTVRQAWRIGDEQPAHILSLARRHHPTPHPNFEPLLQALFVKHVRVGWARFNARQKSPANLFS